MNSCGFSIFSLDFAASTVDRGRCRVETELAHALSKVTSRRLIRLQCFEDLDRHDAVYGGIMAVS